MSENGADKPLIFISYSKFDHKSKAFIERHLGSLRHLGNVELWHDGEIRLGDDWFEEIETKLNSCNVAVLLISTDFLGSDFCMNEEVPTLLEKRRREGMMIAPILVRPCAWKIVPWLAAIQMLPQRDPPTDHDTPLLTLSKLKQEAELTKVVIEIHRFLEEKSKLREMPREATKPTSPLMWRAKRTPTQRKARLTASLPLPQTRSTRSVFHGPAMSF